MYIDKNKLLYNLKYSYYFLKMYMLDLLKLFLSIKYTKYSILAYESDKRATIYNNNTIQLFGICLFFHCKILI